MSVKEIITFSDIQITSEDAILADTSYVLALTGYDGSAKANGAMNLMTKVAEANAIIVITDVTYDEMVNVIMKTEFDRVDHLSSEKERKYYKHRFPNEHNEVLKAIENTYSNHLRTIKSYDTVIDMPTEQHTGLELSASMVRFNVSGPNDCKLIMAAEDIGTNIIATFDQDFLEINYPEITIVTDQDTIDRVT